MNPQSGQNKQSKTKNEIKQIKHHFYGKMNTIEKIERGQIKRV